MRWDEQTAERKRCKNMRKQPAASWRRLWGASFSWRSCQASRFWLVRSRDDFNPAILYQEPVPCISNKSFCASVSKFNLCTFHCSMRTYTHSTDPLQMWISSDTVSTCNICMRSPGAKRIRLQGDVSIGICLWDPLSLLRCAQLTNDGRKTQSHHVCPAANDKMVFNLEQDLCWITASRMNMS